MIEVRRATESDARMLVALAQTTFVETYSEHNRPEDMAIYVAENFNIDKQLKDLRDPKRFIFIAWEEDHAVGFMQLVSGAAHPSVKGPNPIEVLRLYVESRWHGRGVGAALMERGTQFAREKGFQTFWLGVWEHNFRAQHFYSKYGFTKVGQHTFRLGADDQIDFILTCGISSRLR